MSAERVDADFDPAKAEAFAGRFLTALNSGALCLMVSVGHRTGLFDVMEQITTSDIARDCSAGEAERALRPRMVSLDNRSSGNLKIPVARDNGPNTGKFHRKESVTMKQIVCVFALTVAFTSIALGQVAQAPQHQMTDSKKAEMSLYPAAEIQWKDGPASLPAGAKVAVLEGDPAKEGFFTMRLLLPDGFKIQPHWHPKVEHVTVISGTFNVGMGDKFDQTATRAMPAGTFGFWPADMKHFAWANGETVLQLHGTGPWMITYVNPSDDPRKPKQ